MLAFYTPLSFRIFAFQQCRCILQGCLYNTYADPRGEHADVAGDPRWRAELERLQQRARGRNAPAYRPDRGAPDWASVECAAAARGQRVRRRVWLPNDPAQ